MKSGNGGGRRGSGDAKVAQRGGNLLAFFSKKKPAHHGAPPASAVHGNGPPASSNRTTPFAEMLAGAISRNGKTPASALVSVASGQSGSQDSRTVTRESTPRQDEAASVDTNHATPPSPQDHRVAVKSLRSVETPPTEASGLSSPETPPTPDSASNWESAASGRRQRPVGHSSPKRARDASAYETPAAAVAPIFGKPKVRRPASSDGQRQDACKPANKKQKQSNQLFLDFGQKSFGRQSVCGECGMLFMESSEEDVKQHDAVCRDYKEGVACLGWKNERSVSTVGTDERILEIRPGDAPSHWRKVEQVKAIVDKSMGFAQSSRAKEEEEEGAGMTCYLYIAKRRVVGLLAVKRIHRAYRLHEPPGTNRLEENRTTTGNKRGDDGISRSLNSTKAILGVHQIWSHGSHRGRGIASRLVTAARDNLVFGMMVPAELVAFSSPTDEGLRFAKRYVGTDRPLIYDIH